MYYLFGLVKEKLKKEEEAKNFFNEALKINPYLYCALESLIKLSSQQDIYWYWFSEDIFSYNADSNYVEQSSNILFNLTQNEKTKNA